MKIIIEDKMNVLVPSEKQYLKRKADIYYKRKIDGLDEEIEHFPYLFEKAYLSKEITLEQCEIEYEEVDELL